MRRPRAIFYIDGFNLYEEVGHAGRSTRAREHPACPVLVTPLSTGGRAVSTRLSSISAKREQHGIFDSYVYHFDDVFDKAAAPIWPPLEPIWDEDSGTWKTASWWDLESRRWVDDE